jgi:hypothetical protein
MLKLDIRAPKWRRDPGFATPPPFQEGVAILARLLPLLLALGAALIVAIARQRTSRPRTDHTYRPRANPWGWEGSSSVGRTGATESGANWVVSRAEVEGVRDAYSSAALDPSKPLYRCGGCQAYYHRPSLDALEAENRGRCALCGSGDLRAVRVL